jgi:hypothetical protein
MMDYVAREEIHGELALPRVLLLGEDNPYGSDPSFALYCYPIGCAGYRLRRILGLPQHQYLALHRGNLCDGPWSMKEARRRAALLVCEPTAPWRTIVMLGRKVADAFGYEQPFFTSAPAPRTDGEMRLVSLPHPSGRNAGSWTGNARERAREILRELAPMIAWGSAEA